MPSVIRSFDVTPGPQTVLGYLADFGHAEQWDPGTVTCTRVDSGPVAVGARWRNVSKFAGRTVELTYTLRERTEDTLVFVGENHGATSTDTITVRPGGPDGWAGSQVTYRAGLALHGAAAVLGPVLKLIFEKVASDVEARLTEVLNALASAG